MFASPPLDVGRRDSAKQKEIIRTVFAGMGWRTPELLAALGPADDLFFNTISRARVPNWSVGRVALVGDASGGTSIGGMGTGSAIVGAYVLTGELHRSGSDYAGAFQRYQALIAPYAGPSAKNGESSGRFLAPRTAFGLMVRNRLMSFKPMNDWMVAEAGRTGTGIELPDYGI